MTTAHNVTEDLRTSLTKELRAIETELHLITGQKLADAELNHVLLATCGMVVNDASGKCRLWGTEADLSNALKSTRTQMTMAADRWNGQLTDEQRKAGCTVVATPITEALTRLACDKRQLLAILPKAA